MKSTGKIWVFFNTTTQEQSKPMPQQDAQVYILQLKSHEVKNFVVWTPGWEKWKPLKEVLKKGSYLLPSPPPPTSNDEATEVIDVTPKSSSRRINDEKTITQTRKVRSETNSKITNLGEHTYTEIAIGGQTFEDRDFQPEIINWEKTPVAPLLAKSDDNLKDDERREYKRFPHRIEVVLMTKKGRSFRSSSQNISLGGALLREPIPSGLINDVIDLVIVNPFPDKETPSHLLLKGRIVGDSSNRRRLMFYDVSPEVQNKLQLILENYKRNYTQFKKKKAA